MSRILFAWELGAHLGHLTRDLPVAQKLRDAGHQVRFAVRDTRVAAEILPPHRFGFLQAPVCVGRTRLGQAPANYAEMLVAEGWCDRKALLGHISAWCELLAGGTFDAAVADHAPGALIAARITGRIAIPLGNGFEIPPDSEPMPSIRPWENLTRERLLASERNVLADINAIVTQLGGQAYGRLAEIFAPSPIFATFAELDHYGPRNGTCYVGSIHGLSQAPQASWPTGDGPRVLAYLRSHHPATAEVMAALAASGVRAICIVPEANEVFKAQHSSQSVSVFDHPVALDSLLDEADAMIGYASTGAVTAALLKGVPLLMLPAIVEQYLCARRVEAMGAGVIIDGTPERERIREGLAALLGEAKYKAGAASFSAKYATASIQQAATRAARLIMERLDRAAAYENNAPKSHARNEQGADGNVQDE